jgi:hypothetical protein
MGFLLFNTIFSPKIFLNEKITYNTTSVYYPYPIFTSRNEVPSSINIKTVSFIQSNTVPIFQLGSGFTNLMIYTVMKRIIITNHPL